MQKRIALTIVTLWILSLVGVAVVTAQVRPHSVEPKVLSGTDIGFQVTAIDPKEGSALGYLVVKVNDNWVRAAIGGSDVPGARGRFFSVPQQ